MRGVLVEAVVIHRSAILFFICSSDASPLQMRFLRWRKPALAYRLEARYGS